MGKIECSVCGLYGLQRKKNCLVSQISILYLDFPVSVIYNLINS